ncbi:hypothetical protein QSU92_07645 [Microbacterium sp. ET2]|uniref:hypothetical protein n=1 Tax=Microbacterium albipurpureum TaxID=3050384 RepID=UPI00259C9F21|nr:hypothetical protein [Microbacterium sp. ET2 (Ac-2212)]WJL97029.1 hypothetical protein QSU92_07645 [Microbacterium sp. ET2 (Ac-2212)]
MARTNRRSIAWAVIGAIVLIIGIAALTIASLSNAGSTPPSPEPTTTSASTPDPTPTLATAVVDESVITRGWVPEPVTTDPETYVRAALAAAGTFDTTKAEYEEWIAYLGTWFTPDTRYASEADRIAELEAAKLETRQTVVLPEAEWDSLAGENGRVSSVTTGDVSFSPVPEDQSGDMSSGTADITITFTRSDGAGGEVSYEEQTRLSVQVLCGGASVPTPDSSQAAGDCKVVRLFSEPVEP